MSSKAAPFGAVFDAHGWRSLAPITHTFSTNVYTPDGLFDFTNDATVKALEVMKQMMEVAPNNILEEGKVDAGVNTTPDEEVFAARQAAYYVKYQNAPTRFAGTWPDPSVLHIAGLPKQPGGAGGTVFWNTGATLFKYGENKQEAADYMSYLTHDLRIWKHALGKDVRGASGQLAPYKSMWAKWQKSPPPWMADWAFTVRKQLATSKAIRTNTFGLHAVRDRQAGLGGVPEGRREGSEEGAGEGARSRPRRGEEAEEEVSVRAELVFPPEVRRPGGG